MRKHRMNVLAGKVSGDYLEAVPTEKQLIKVNAHESQHIKQPYVSSKVLEAFNYINRSNESKVLRAIKRKEMDKVRET